jgi:hypothetical protein
VIFTPGSTAAAEAVEAIPPASNKAAPVTSTFFMFFSFRIGDGLRVSRANKKPFEFFSGGCRVKRGARVVKFFLPR